MDAWRICFAEHAAEGRTAFSGIGARSFGGRWNSKGVAAAYASSTLSLAALEYLVHADEPLLREAKLVSCRAHWGDEVSTETAPRHAYVTGWRRSPAPPALAEYGNRWVAEQRSAVLLVRSAIIPSEMNMVLNPAHPDARHIAFDAPEPFGFDPRLS